MSTINKEVNINWIKIFFYAVAFNYIIMLSLSVIVQYELLNDWIAKGIVVFTVCISIVYVMNKRDKSINNKESIV